MNQKIIVEKVEIHRGEEFSGAGWKSSMQVIYTNKGLFIDNLEGRCFGQSNIMWEGINWKRHIGKEVEIIIVNCIGKVIRHDKYQVTNSLGDLKDDSCKHPRGCSNHNWAYPYFILGPLA